jgi:hypothetical protein
LKNDTISRYGEITFKILKGKLIKFIRIKAHLNVSIMYPLGTKKLDKWKENFISKQLLKTRSNSTFSKVHNYHLVKVSQKKITFNFMISFFNPCLVTLNNLEWDSIWILDFFNNPINWPIHIFYFKSPLLIMIALFSKNNYANVFIINVSFKWIII